MDTTNNNNKSNFVLSASVLIAAVLISAAVIYDKGSTNLNQGQPAELGNVVNTDVFAVQKDDVVLGEEKAPITIFIYSDPSCPFCAAADGGNQEVINYLKSNMPSWTAPVPGIVDAYVNSGEVRLVYRYFPGHGTGEEAMKVLYCANEQDKFWELSRVIADNQSVVEDLAKVKELAAGVGADVAKINNCLDSKKYDYKLTSDTESGKKAGVNGTPAFFVNGQLISGAQPFSEFKKVIDPILSK